MDCRLIIFDFDGTLADTFSWFVNTFDEAADKYQFKRLDRSNVAALRGLDAKQIMVRHEISFWKLPFIVRHMRALMKRDIAGIRLFPGIEYALRDLSERGAILAIVTSNSRANVVEVLGSENAKRFSYFECASVFGKRTKLRRVLAASQIPPEAAILVGDEIRDAQAAKEAGISFGAVSWGYNHVEFLISHGAHEVFMHAADLARKLIPRKIPNHSDRPPTKSGGFENTAQAAVHTQIAPIKDVALYPIASREPKFRAKTAS
jgi:phosphoglycolate phosphatase